MLLVQTYIAPSSIEGMGVFAAEAVPAGALVWTLDPNFDRIVYRADLAALPATAQRFLERYAYFDSALEGYLLDGDHARFLNHSEDPAIAYVDDGDGYARRDIAAGEELTCNYRDFMDELTFARHAPAPAPVVAATRPAAGLAAKPAGRAAAIAG